MLLRSTNEISSTLNMLKKWQKTKFRRANLREKKFAGIEEPSSGQARWRGKVVHETQYFADPFEAPAWRSG
jgi:hypothetical protein